MIISIWFPTIAHLSYGVNNTALEAHLLTVLPDIDPTTSSESVWGVFRTTSAQVEHWAKDRKPRPSIRGL